MVCSLAFIFISLGQGTNNSCSTTILARFVLNVRHGPRIRAIAIVYVDSSNIRSFFQEQSAVISLICDLWQRDMPQLWVWFPWASMIGGWKWSMSISSEGVGNVMGTIFELLSEPGKVPREYLGTEIQINVGHWWSVFFLALRNLFWSRCRKYETYV